MSQLPLPGLNPSSAKDRYEISQGTAPKRRGRPLPRVPVRWVKFLAGLFLLPPCWFTTSAFFSSFTATTIQHAFWLTEEFWFFAIGALVWLCWFFGLRKPVLIYVFGHEVTHAIWVWLMGGRVSGIEFGSDGGQIVTDKTNFWIALAPYFFPIYSVIVLALYALVSAFGDPEPLRRWAFGLLGATWCFHLTFTCWMLARRQTDLAEHGAFFSLVVIYLMNLAVLSLLLIAAAPDVTPLSYAASWSAAAGDFSDTILKGIDLGGDALFGLLGFSRR